MGKFEAKKEKKKNPPQVEMMLYLRELLYLLAVIVLLFIFVLRVVVVSGPSMYDTLYDGDAMILITSPFAGAPEQGDIVVLSRSDYKEGTPLVKRVIATEGQTVDIDFFSGVVYVDGEALVEPYANGLTFLDEGMEFPVTINEGCLFVLGDNRNDSTDSRDPKIGQVDRREILGKAFFLYMPGTHMGVHERDLGRVGLVNR